jgi:hypothetical protein
MTCDVAHEELAEFASGDLAPARAEVIKQHLSGCAACRRRLELLSQVDAALKLLPRTEPSAAALLKTRRILSAEIRGSAAPEIMTLDDVARFLHITDDALGEIVEELPAFEIAGEIRVRRAKLLEWIEQRELSFMRSTTQSQVSRMLSRVLAQGTS